MTLKFLAVPVVVLVLLASGMFPLAAQVEQEDPEEEFIRSRAELGDSHASGGRPELGPTILGNPTQSVVTMRIGLYYSSRKANGALLSEFSTLHHAHVEISNTAGDAHVIDRATAKQVVAISPGTIVRVTHDGTGYQVSADGVALGTFEGPIFFRPSDPANLFRVESILRSFGGVKVPSYRGAIEIARGRATLANRVNVVNVVELEDYVQGVVANESIASVFHMEALKAQAVAARGYAVANVGRFARFGYPFDVVDSSSSQVYRGVISEYWRAVQASRATTGLVASHNGQIIGALYSSSFGGHSDNNEWIFNNPSNELPGRNAVGYLRGIYDGDGVPPDFSSDAGIEGFWTVPTPSNFDDCVRAGNRFSRWRLVLTAAQIKSRLTAGRFVLISGNTSGAITDVEITKRMTSGRAAIAKITLTTGVAEVQGWDDLRFVLGRTAVSTPAMCIASNIAANFSLTNPSVVSVTKNADGTVKDLTAWGGGWGHNVGYSQYGAHGRGRAGQDFIEILKGYYTGVDVGSYPIDIGREPGSGPPTLRQEFIAPNARGTLFVRSSGMESLRVHVNGAGNIALGEEDLAAAVVAVDISPYLIEGMNSIQYNPVGLTGRATVTVVVE